MGDVWDNVYSSKSYISQFCLVLFYLLNFYGCPSQSVAPVNPTHSNQQGNFLEAFLNSKSGPFKIHSILSRTQLLKLAIHLTGWFKTRNTIKHPVWVSIHFQTIPRVVSLYCNFFKYSPSCYLQCLKSCQLLDTFKVGWKTIWWDFPYWFYPEHETAEYFLKSALIRTIFDLP